LDAVPYPLVTDGAALRVQLSDNRVG